jgi:preprotein translocase subunit SecE
MWQKIRGFIDDVGKELKRTSWPSRNEVQGTTLVVIVAVMIVAAYLGAVDVVLTVVVRKVLFPLFGAVD